METARFPGNYMTELHCFIVRCHMVLSRNVSRWKGEGGALADHAHVREQLARFLREHRSEC